MRGRICLTKWPMASKYRVIAWKKLQNAPAWKGNYEYQHEESSIKKQELSCLDICLVSNLDSLSLSLQTLNIKSKDPTSECNKSSNSSFDSSSPGILEGSCWKIKTVSVWFLYSYDNDVLIWLHLIHCEWKWVTMFQLFQSDSSKLPAVFPVWTKMSAAIRTSSSRFLWDVKRLKRLEKIHTVVTSLCRCLIWMVT